MKPMPNVVFAAPILSENASRMIEAVAGLPDVTVGVITQDPAEKMWPELASKGSAHWRVNDILAPGQLTCAAKEFSR